MRDVTGFFDALLRYEIGLWEVLDKDVRSALGISLGRLRALRVVGERDRRARVQDVADELMITVGAASKLVDRLERDGTVRRTPNPDDRRSSLIGLTSAGESTRSRGEDVVRSALERCLPPTSVTDDELTSVTALLSRLSGILESGEKAGQRNE